MSITDPLHQSEGTTKDCVVGINARRNTLRYSSRKLLRRARPVDLSDDKAAIPGQYFNHINHAVEMIRQNRDVACAKYRLECPQNIQVTAVGMSSIRGKFK